MNGVGRLFPTKGRGLAPEHPDDTGCVQGYVPIDLGSQMNHAYLGGGRWLIAGATVIATVLVALSMGSRVAWSSLAGWAGASLLLTLILGVVVTAFGASGDRDVNPRGWRWCFVVLSALQGVVWGGGAWFCYVVPVDQGAIVYLVALLGLMAVAASSQAAIIVAAWAFVVPAGGLLAARVLSQGGAYAPEIAGAVIGVTLLLSCLACRLYRALRKALMQDEQNRRLVADLSQREQHFQNLIDNVSDLIAVVDRRGQISFHSPSTERLLGVRRDALIGRNISDIVHPDDLVGLMADFATLLQDNQRVASRDVQLRHISGEWRAMHVHGRALTSEIGAESIVLSAQDATEQMKVRETLRIAKEQAEAMGRAKTDFLAVMSHEIRTPMSGIIGLIDLLKTTGLTEKQREYVGALDRAGEHLSDLLNDILDFSKIEANKLESERIVFDLRKMLGGVMDIFRARAEAQGVRLVARVSDSLPRLWTGDVRHTRQVLANLLGNAVKFTETGYVEVCIDRDGTAADGRTLLKIAVEDTGIGIADDKLSHIFEPFAQADASPSRRHGGTGLGLAISQRLVDLMQGRIWAVSRLGRGSTFFVVLPLEEGVSSGAAEHAPPATRRPHEGYRFADSEVLVVDDSDLNRLVIGDMLHSLGLRVNTAANGAEAVEKFADGAYALVFLDIQMPVMDGFAAAEAMRECEEFSRRPHCPIIALSATALKDDQERALEAGCDDYLVKPMRKESLIALLKTYLPLLENTPDASTASVVQALFNEDIPVPVLEPELLPLLPSFFAHLDNETAQLVEALEKNDILALERVAHQAKGNAMLFGFQALVDILRGLEFAARAEREGDALRDELSLEERLATILREVEQLRKSCVNQGFLGSIDKTVPVRAE